MSRIFPTISQYIDAIQIPDSFTTFKSLRPVLKEDGTPYFSSGNFAVVFKMIDVETSIVYAIKCFLRDVEKRTEANKLISDYLDNVISPYIIQYRYYEKELWVTDDDYPIQIMTWIDGVNLLEFLEEQIQSCNVIKVKEVALAFDQMAIWLLNQDFAHGDIKPDNIILNENGLPVFVDYDGCYVPLMEGWKPLELGTSGYQHPMRNLFAFNKHIDNVGILVLSIYLHSLALNPSLWKNILNGDALLFTSDGLNYFETDFWKKLVEMNSKILQTRLSFLQYILNNGEAVIGLIEVLKINKFEIDEYSSLLNKAPNNDLRLIKGRECKAALSNDSAKNPDSMFASDNKKNKVSYGKSELPTGLYNMTFMVKCKAVKDGKIGAIYGNHECKTILWSDQMMPYGISHEQILSGESFPEKIEFTVDEDHNIFF